MALKIKNAFYLLLAVNILYISIVLYWANPIALGDFMQLETAQNSFEANQILAYWNDQQLIDKVLVFLHFNILYIPLYIALLSAALFKATIPTKNEILIKAAKFFAVLLIVAGICDLVELIALQHFVQNGMNEWNLHLSYDMAATKYSILLVTVLLLMIAMMYNLLEKYLPSEKKEYFNSKP